MTSLSATNAPAPSSTSGSSREITQECVTKTSGVRGNRLRTAIYLANRRVFRAAEGHDDYTGMGTTVISIVVRDDQAFFAHVGDSRAYLIRGELIQQISEDHSLVNEQIKAGMITPEEAKHSRYKNIITRSVGFEEGRHARRATSAGSEGRRPSDRSEQAAPRAS